MKQTIIITCFLLGYTIAHANSSNECLNKNIEKDINSTMKITRENKNGFYHDGFTVINNFFEKEFIDYISGLHENILKKVSIDEDYGFKLKYNTLDNDERLKKIISSKTFKKALTYISGRDLLFLGSISFTIENDYKGFPYHVGVNSFAIHDEDDFALTLWFPDVSVGKDNGGGLKFISKGFLNGKGAFKTLSDCFNNGLQQLFKPYNMLTAIMYYSKSFFAIENEPDLMPGDVVIFDKYTLHKTSPLRNKYIKKRTGVALRFVDYDSIYSKSTYKNIAEKKMSLKVKDWDKFENGTPLKNVLLNNTYLKLY